jgi:tRNA (mo5U34)-methyltransferase
MIALSDQQLQDFQAAVNWEIGERLPDGRILGSPEKHNCLVERVPATATFVAERFRPAEKTILELGCAEGIHTVQLAKMCKHVTALEVRPKNVICALIRLCLHEVSNAKVLVKDVRELDESFGRFDILYHAGVLYHLDNPVEHLYKIANLADELLLDTHYCTDDTSLPRSDIHYNGKTYKAFLYQEFGWADVWSGVEPTSRWLHKDALLGLLNEVGYDDVDIAAEHLLNGCNRMTVLARRTGKGI